MTKLYIFSLFNPVRQVKYFALSALDEGGFGKVWSGVTAQGLPIAIKVIKPSSDFNRDFTSWFTDQQIHLQCLYHPYVVTTFDQFVSQEGALVLVMEKGGGSLESLLNQGKKWSNKSICAIAAQILSALHYIHRIGVIHRDVTLKNVIWFNRGIFKLCDFGISKQIVSAEEYARTFIGHQSYIPPELLNAGYSSFQSDIYQLGLVLLSLMIGRHPIPTDATPEETRRMILNGEPRQIAESLIGTCGETAKLISIMLRRRVQYRFKTAAEAWAEFNAEFKIQDYLHQILQASSKPKTLKIPPWLLDK